MESKSSIETATTYSLHSAPNSIADHVSHSIYWSKFNMPTMTADANTAGVSIAADATATVNPNQLTTADAVVASTTSHPKFAQQVHLPLLLQMPLLMLLSVSIKPVFLPRLLSLLQISINPTLLPRQLLLIQMPLLMPLPASTNPILLPRLLLLLQMPIMATINPIFLPSNSPTFCNDQSLATPKEKMTYIIMLMWNFDDVMLMEKDGYYTQGVC